MNVDYKNGLWFDYKVLDLSSPLFLGGSKDEQGHVVHDETSEQIARNNGEELSQKLFTERFELFGKSKQLHDCLKNISKEREEKAVVCFERTKNESVCEVRRLCICQSVGRKFCAICRRDICKGLSHDIPGIIGEHETKHKVRKPSLLVQLQQAGAVLSLTKPVALSRRSPSIEKSPSEDNEHLSNMATGVQQVPDNTTLSTGVTSSVVSVPTTTSDKKEDEGEFSKNHNKKDPPQTNPTTWTHTTSGKQITARGPGSECGADIIIVDQLGASEPRYNYPVGPELIELKYINCDIYDIN